MSIYTKIIDLQKLNEAWKKVKRNKPASGADDITYEEFDNNLAYELKQLKLELEEHEYHVFPVKIVKMQKGEKVRELALYSMRDKVVQASIANELVKIYENRLSNCAYAYRNDLSAMIAIEHIELQIKKGSCPFICKTDIKGFFDNISLEILKRKLSFGIKECDVVDLIMKELRVPSVDKYGDLLEKEIGLYQGSGISPVLSNIYLMELDKKIEEQQVFYIRYADDILIMTSNKDKLIMAVNTLKTLLGELRLELNADKTFLGSIADGFDFLGYHFDSFGKSIPGKAVEKLETSLEDVWLTMVGAGIDEKLVKCSQILNGWEQFYKGEKIIHNIYEYVVLVYMVHYKDVLPNISELRCNYHNANKEIAEYLISIWKENDWSKNVLIEYEQILLPEGDNSRISDDRYIAELNCLYEKLFVSSDVELWKDVMQVYSDLGFYNIAEKIMELINKLKDECSYVACQREDTAGDKTNINYDSSTIELFEQCFRGREDMYTREILDGENRRKSEFAAVPLTRDVIRKHLSGSETIGTYLVRNNDTVHYVVFDIDVSRKVLLKDDSKLPEYLDIAGRFASDLCKTIGTMGLKAYIEFSGYRGFHVWIFFSEWLQVRYAYSLMDIIERKMDKIPDNITIERFPAKNKKKNGSSGQNIKLPYGIHIYTGNRAVFLHDDMSYITDVNNFLSTLARYSIDNIKRVIGANISDVREDKTINMPEQKEIRIDYEKLGDISEGIKAVLEGCSLMKYLVSKSVNTGYLSHFERLSILNVFGHVGNAGKEFVHLVMSFTINYQYNTTQKFIDRLPEKPISCIKLRDQYKLITAEFGCGCVFKRTKNCYPSPVIHALKNGVEDNRDITLPTSRTVSASKKESVYEELNIHTKVQSLAEKIVELKKQKRGIDKSVKKVEKELCEAFDNAGVDCMEVEMGLLVRRKKDNEYEWLIEI